jgi:hypothetical protein
MVTPASVNKNIINGINKLIEETTYVMEYLESEKVFQDSIESLVIKLKLLKKSIELIESYPYKLKTGEQLSNIKGINQITINRVNYILSYGQPPSEYDPVLINRAYEYQKNKQNIKDTINIGVENKDNIIDDIINNLSEEDILSNTNTNTNTNTSTNTDNITTEVNNKLNSQQLIKNYPYAIKSKKEKEHQTNTKIVNNNDIIIKRVCNDIQPKIQNKNELGEDIKENIKENINVNIKDDNINVDSFFGCLNSSFYESIQNLKEVFCSKQTDIYNFFD